MTTSAPIPVIALCEGIHVTLARAKARNAGYGKLLSRPGAKRYREVDLAEYARATGTAIDPERLEQCRAIHRASLEAARLQRISGVTS